VAYDHFLDYLNRLRRVKCDETKPSCLRCQKFRVECDGCKSSPSHGIRFHGIDVQLNFLDNHKRQTNPKPLALAPRILPAVRHSPVYETHLATPLFSSDIDFRYFQLFINNSIYEFIPYCPEPEPHVGPNCCFVLSMRHAGIALGALHKSSLVAQSRALHSQAEAYSHHLKAIRHYDLAIRHLREELASKKMDLRCTLMSCLLTFGFEAFLGNNQMALNQILCGLSFIAAWRSSHAAGKQDYGGLYIPSPPDLGDDINQFFGRLELQMMAIQGQKRSAFLEYSMPERIGNYHLELMPSYFENIYDAQGYLHLLMKRLEFFLPTAKILDSRIQIDSWITAERRLEAEKMQALQIHQAEHWSKAFNTTLEQEHSRSNVGGLMVTTILLHFKTYYLILTTILSSPMVYDSMDDIFEEIIEISIKSTALMDSRLHGTRFNFDLGSILPLYIVALNCRTKSIRRRAIGLLLDHPRREGIWDSIFAGRVATWVMELEEQWMEDGVVPAWARVRDVGSDFESNTRSAVTKCLQRVKSHNGFVVVERRVVIEW
jgi:hypothetical protein